MRLYDFAPSGNGYKVRLLLNLLERSYERVLIDIMAGESHTPEFLAKNQLGKVPLLELEDGTCLAESNAILTYLADGTDLLPTQPMARAQVLRWMFWEQNGHEWFVAGARFLARFFGPERADELELRRAGGRRALEAMETHLGTADWFGAETPSIADIALYPYTRTAPEGGLSLEPFAAVRAWLERVESLPRFIPFDS